MRMIVDRRFSRVLWFVAVAGLLALSAAAQTLDVSTKGRAAVGTQAMATTAHPLATRAAIAILQQGGNAVDAAVAAAFAIGVVEPDGSGLGGGGGMVLYLPSKNKTVYINYYQRASENANSLSFEPKRDAQTARAILIPGTAAGLTRALKEFGTLPLATVMEAAIRYADEGFPIDETLAKIILDNSEMLQRSPTTAAVYLRDGFPLAEGDTLRQPALAATLRRIAAEGRDGFYRGPVAEHIVRDVTANGGAMTLDDLSSYAETVGEPVRGSYRGYELISANAPHAGATVIEALNILENTNLRATGPFERSAASIHMAAEALRRAYADRQAFIGDPKFVDVPVKGLTSKAFARTRFADINPAAADPPEYRKTKAGNPLPFEHDSGPAEQQKPGARERKPAWDDRDDDGTGNSTDSDSLFDSWGRTKKKKDTETVPDETRPDTAASVPVEESKEQELVMTDAGLDPLFRQETGGHTTHLSVIDRQGNAVSLTQTLGTFFGSGLISEGVLFNNGMSNFSTQSADNAVQPRKQPRSSISPTIILKDGRFFMTVGSPGATRIPATVVQLISNVIDFGMNADAANDAPRFFCQKNDDYLHLESRIGAQVQEELKTKGHKLRVYGDFDLFFGGAQMILFNPATGQYFGSADPRRGGVAIGY